MPEGGRGKGWDRAAEKAMGRAESVLAVSSYILNHNDMEKDDHVLSKLLVAAAYLVMITANVLAVSRPLNGVTTGQVSEAYPNLFAPAGFAFAIWGLIYLLLALYVLYRCGWFQKAGEGAGRELSDRIGSYFVLSSLLNAAWIFAWHYGFIGLSLVLMAGLLLSLVRIADILRGERLPFREEIAVRLPFSVYFGWITVATIANATVFLVSIGWEGLGAPAAIWTSLVLLAGALIGMRRMNRDQDIAYGSVLVWAYSWILYKHIVPEGFAWRYPLVIITAAGCLLLFLLSIGKQLSRKKTS